MTAEDARWTAWVERSRQDDLAFTHTVHRGLLAAAAFGLLVAATYLSLAGGR